MSPDSSKLSQTAATWDTVNGREVAAASMGWFGKRAFVAGPPFVAVVGAGWPCWPGLEGIAAPGWFRNGFPGPSPRAILKAMMNKEMDDKIGCETNFTNNAVNLFKSHLEESRWVVCPHGCCYCYYYYYLWARNYFETNDDGQVRCGWDFVDGGERLGGSNGFLIFGAELRDHGKRRGGKIHVGWTPLGLTVNRWRNCDARKLVEIEFLSLQNSWLKWDT